MKNTVIKSLFLLFVLLLLTACKNDNVESVETEIKQEQNSSNKEAEAEEEYDELTEDEILKQIEASVEPSEEELEEPVKNTKITVGLSAIPENVRVSSPNKIFDFKIDYDESTIVSEEVMWGKEIIVYKGEEKVCKIAFIDYRYCPTVNELNDYGVRVVDGKEKTSTYKSDMIITDTCTYHYTIQDGEKLADLRNLVGKYYVRDLCITSIIEMDYDYNDMDTINELAGELYWEFVES